MPREQAIWMSGGQAALSLREEQKLFTRRRLLDAARRVFAARGYGASGIDDLVAAAGVGRATFYLHFANKSEVMAEVSRELLPEAAIYWRKLDRSLGSSESVREWLSEVLQWWEKHRDLLPAIHEATFVDRAFAAEQYRSLRLMTGELTSYLGRAHAPSRREVRLRIELLVLQLDQFCLNWIVQKAVAVDRDLVLGVLTDIWCVALRIPREERRPQSGRARQRGRPATKAQGSQR